MNRLTADLISKSPAFRNTLKQRELDLRGNKIPRIENLGATQNQFDTIDLTNNQIEALTDFPKLTRLTTLLINNNLVNRIDNNISDCLPNLQNLMITNNHIRDINSLEPLMQLTKLEHLSLLDNPVTQTENYRLYMIGLFPSLKFLDFQKITKKERDEAQKLINSLTSAE